MAVAVLFGEQEVRNKSIASFQACTRQVRYTPSCGRIAAAQRTAASGKNDRLHCKKEWGRAPPFIKADDRLQGKPRASQNED